jgi:hypothetical protein
MTVKAVLLVIYLIGAICTAWCLSVPTVSGERRSFLRVSFVIWPFTVTVFGVLVLLALLVHWYHRLALALTGHEADFQQSPAAAAAPDAGNDPQARIQAAQAEGSEV